MAHSLRATNITVLKAQHAFEKLYHRIMQYGHVRKDTKALMNVGVLIEKPLARRIATPWRKWNEDYAEAEWQWYLSGNPNAEPVAKRAKIWRSLMDSKGNVNSNYGYQWVRAGQLEKVVQMLKSDPLTRKASISLYDGKEIDKYTKDTVCTYAINFFIEDHRLCMQVAMRSNDLVFGFCNDQYCFSKLQEMVADRLGLDVGYYYHWAANMHVYERHWKLLEC